MSLHYLERRLAMDFIYDLDDLKEPFPEDWVQCKDCIYRDDCEDREAREGCYLGEDESSVLEYYIGREED